MNNYRKWILCGVGWLMLYLYFDPRLFTFSIRTMWRLWSMLFAKCELYFVRLSQVGESCG
jgi:hypothetical protein